VSSSSLKANVLEVTPYGGLGGYRKNYIMYESMGLINTEVREFMPVVASYSPIPHVVYNFIAFTDFTQGYTQSADDPIQYFGSIRIMNYITEGE
jgi:hypothetical protein